MRTGKPALRNNWKCSKICGGAVFEDEDENEYDFKSTPVPGAQPGNFIALGEETDPPGQIRRVAVMVIHHGNGAGHIGLGQFVRCWPAASQRPTINHRIQQRQIAESFNQCRS